MISWNTLKLLVLATLFASLSVPLKYESLFTTTFAHMATSKEIETSALWFNISF